MAQCDFLPVATGTNANVDTQAAFAGAGYQQNGFQSGISLSRQFNKVWRQANFVGSALAQFVSNVLGQNVLDNGDQAGFISQIQQAIQATANVSVSPAVTTVAYSPTPVFDCSLGNQIVVVFYITLTGNVTSSSIVNERAGQIIIFNIAGPGGLTFTPPPQLPMSSISPQSGNSTQQFLCLGTNAYLAMTPMMTH